MVARHTLQHWRCGDYYRRQRLRHFSPVAESLTGWTQEGAAGVPLESVFKIVNEETRRTVENPATRALREGVIVGLANHTLLVAKDGTVSLSMTS